MQNTIKKFLISAVFVAGILLGGTAAFAAGPTIVTNSPTNLTQTTATMNGTFILNGGATAVDVWFIYGTNQSMTQSTAHQTINATNGTFSAPLAVTPGTQYFYMAEGIVAGQGSGFGSMVSFTAPSYSLPTATTSSASSITSTGATLNGYFNGNGTATQTRFEYANNSGMVGSTYTTWTAQAGTSGAFSDTISGLTANSTYYFRAIAKNSAGVTIANSIVPFTTSTTGGGTNTPCVINSFTGAQSTIAQYANTTLTWNTTNCTTTSISPSIGAVFPAAGGTISTGSLSGTTTFTLAASNATSTVTLPVTITVTTSGNNSSNCVISYFNQSQTISYGTSATLSWNTTGCSYTTLSGGTMSGTYGTYNGGLTTGALYNTTYYTLTAYAANGSATNAYVTITVTPTYVPPYNPPYNPPYTPPVVYTQPTYTYSNPTTPTNTVIYHYVNATTPTTTGTNNALAMSSTLPFTTSSNIWNASNPNMNGSNLAGNAIFAGNFFPTTLAGWLLLFLVIFAVIYLAGRIRSKRAQTNH